MEDSILELWLCLTALHITHLSEHEFDACKIRRQWLLASRGYFNGCVPHNIEEATLTKNGKHMVLDAIHSLLLELSKAPNRLDKNVINLLGCDKWETNIETSRLIELSNAIIDLINGKVGSEPKDTSFMPGSR